MGFGILFVGYFVAYVMSFIFIPKLIGYVLMIWATAKLSQYDLAFKRCIFILGLLSVMSVYSFTGSIFEYFSLESAWFGVSVKSLIQTAEKAVSLIFHIFLMLAMRHIAIETELPKLAYKSVRNISIGMLSTAVYLLSNFLPNSESTKTIALAAFILELVWIVLNLMLMASYYRFICDESDRDMEVKSINIPIIGKMEEIMRKRDQNAFDSGKDLVEKRRRKKETKKNNRKK